MKLVRTLLATVLSASIPFNALAQPHVIARLGNAPVLGELTSTPQLQAQVKREQRLFASAGAQLGLTPREYAQVVARINTKQLTYVTIPRHLDAMSWSTAGVAHVVRDVIIPPKTNGWEIDLLEGHRILAVFIPARCGNISILRKTLPVIAMRRRRAPRVLAAETAPPATPAPTASPAQVVQVPSPPPPTPAPLAGAAATTPGTHHFGWWPLLLIPIIGLIGHGGTHGPSITSTPPPVGCPQSRPRK